MLLCLFYCICRLPSSPRLWDVCCTSCASSRCRLVKARWPSATAASPYRTTPATPMICTALSVSPLYYSQLIHFVFCFFLVVSLTVVVFFRIHVGAGSRQKTRHLPGVLFCFQASSADVPGSECEGQSLSAGTSGFAWFSLIRNSHILCPTNQLVGLRNAWTLMCCDISLLTLQNWENCNQKIVISAFCRILLFL